VGLARVGVRARALAPRRRTALGALLRPLVRRPRSRRRRAGAGTPVQPQRAEEPGLCPELGGNVRTAPRLCLAHCGDLAFPAASARRSWRSSGARGLFSGPRGTLQGAAYRCCSRTSSGAGVPEGRWSGGYQKREAPSLGSGEGGREVWRPRAADGSPPPAPRLRGTSSGSIVPARVGGAEHRAPPGIERRPPGFRDTARTRTESGGRRAGARHAGTRLPAQATASSPEAEPKRQVR
jgi:hypothetical protein